jgi:hypothetical protein
MSAFLELEELMYGAWQHHWRVRAQDDQFSQLSFQRRMFGLK